jgi:ribose transport system ATP-binding protein
VAYISADRLSEGGIKDFSLGRNLTLSSLKRYLRIRGLGVLDKARERRAATEASGSFGVVAHSIDQLFGTLSGGNQQKAIVARALQSGADTLVIDSPTVGVDVAARADIYALLRGLSRDGRAILIASTDIDELADLCDRVVVLRDGAIRVVEAGELSRERIRAAYFGSEKAS